MQVHVFPYAHGTTTGNLQARAADHNSAVGSRHVKKVQTGESCGLALEIAVAYTYRQDRPVQ